MVISSKWGATFTYSYDITPEAARKSIQGSLERLGVEYIDLWILRGHGPGGADEGFDEAIQTMSVCCTCDGCAACVPPELPS